MTNSAAAIPAFIISREFPVPVATLYRMWSVPEAMAQWWGPKGASVSVADMDLRPGGSYHYGMKMPDGLEMWGLRQILDVEPLQRLVFINSFSNAERGLTRHPMNADWPLELMSDIQFEETAAGSRVTISWLPHNAFDTEIATFDAGRESMMMGWGGSLDSLEKTLKES